MTLMQATQSKKDNQSSNQPKLRADKAPDNVHISAIAGLVSTLFYRRGDHRRHSHGRGQYRRVDHRGLGDCHYACWALTSCLRSRWPSSGKRRSYCAWASFKPCAGRACSGSFPIVDATPVWIDHRVMVTPFNAEKTLTKDTVPVDVDAVLFWVIWDAEKAALEVADYRAAISWASQTALREVIGQMTLADILVGRARMDADLQKIIDERTTPWGITVQSVEIRDVIIPQGLEDAMSQQAQAERERQSRVILGEAEMQVAASFAEASKAYVDNPTALHLRAMNMLFEGLKDKGALVIVPSSAVDTMNLGGLSGMVSLAQQNRKAE